MAIFLMETKGSEFPLGPGDDAYMIEHPEYWPAWPFLPLKNCNEPDPTRGWMPRVAFMHAKCPLVVYYDVDIFTFSLVKMPLSSLICEKFSNAESIVAAGWAGWEVD